MLNMELEGEEMNEKPTGYKLTQIGEIPEDWEVVRLGEVISFTRKPKHLNLNQKVIPFISMESIPQGKIFIDGFTLKSSEEITTGVYCEKGDILLAKITPCFENGKQGVVENIPSDFAFATTEVFAFKPILSLVDKYFIFYLLIFPSLRAELIGKMEGATGRKRIPRNALESLPIPLPPLSEQRRIARVLSTVQKAIEQQDEIIKKARELKRGLMKKLFTEGLGNAPLKETEIGPMPEHWEVVRLGEVCERPQYGYTASAVDAPIGPKFLRITDIQDKSVDWSSVPYCKINKEELHKYQLRPGDILFARIGATTGKTYLIKDPPPAIFASYLIRVRTKDDLLPEYLAFFTETETYWLQINASKGGRLK